MAKIEYLRSLIAGTSNWYHRHIYQTQLDRLEGKPRITKVGVYPSIEEIAGRGAV